jgi:hypothetical protein
VFLQNLEDTRTLSHGPEFTKHYVKVMLKRYDWKFILRTSEHTYWNLKRGSELIKMTEALKGYGYLEAA